MSGLFESCPNCGCHDLDPRKILIGLPFKHPKTMEYQEILTLKCQNCGWLGEMPRVDSQLRQ